MAHIIFYEKPGCINGEKQKKVLLQAGNSLECRNILTTSWTREKLLPFVEGRSAGLIVNPSAPAVKSGEVVPKELGFEEAITMMCNDPLLIKRPLIEVAGKCLQGFDHGGLKKYLGSWKGLEDLITCPRLHSASCDEVMEK